MRAKLKEQAFAQGGPRTVTRTDIVKSEKKTPKHRKEWTAPYGSIGHHGIRRKDRGCAAGDSVEPIMNGRNRIRQCAQFRERQSVEYYYHRVATPLQGCVEFVLILGSYDIE